MSNNKHLIFLYTNKKDLYMNVIYNIDYVVGNDNNVNKKNIAILENKTNNINTLNNDAKIIKEYLIKSTIEDIEKDVDSIINEKQLLVFINFPNEDILKILNKRYDKLGSVIIVQTFNSKDVYDTVNIKFDEHNLLSKEEGVERIKSSIYKTIINFSEEHDIQLKDDKNLIKQYVLDMVDKIKDKPLLKDCYNDYDYEEEIGEVFDTDTIEECVKDRITRTSIVDGVVERLHLEILEDNDYLLIKENGNEVLLNNSNIKILYNFLKDNIED